MQLTLSSRSPWKSDYHDSQTGELLYKATIHHSLFGPTTITLDRAIAAVDRSTQPQRQGGSQFTRVSTIEFHAFSSNVISIGGRDFPASELLHRKGVLKSLFGRDRYMIGPDGTEYKWVTGFTKPELYLADASSALVVKYHRPHFGFFSSSGSRPASLEFFAHQSQFGSASYHQSGGYDQATIDLILTTFIYLEKKRKDEERRRSGAGGGGGGGDGGGG